MRKPVNDRPAGDSDATLRIDTDGLLARRAPTVLQWLSDDRWDDGSTRQPSTLLVFAEDGCLKACLNDRDGSRSVFVTGGSLEGILDTLEAGLQEDSLPWRAKRDQPRKGRK